MGVFDRDRLSVQEELEIRLTYLDNIFVSAAEQFDNWIRRYVNFSCAVSCPYNRVTVSQPYG
jgi:hypothetical protein